MAPASTVDFLISTKLPTFAFAPMSAPGLRRANGPISRAGRDRRPLEMREGVNRRAVLDHDAQVEHDVWLDQDVAADFRVPREKHRLRRDERRSGHHRLPAQPRLHRGFRGGELHPVVDPHDLRLVGLERLRGEAARGGDLDEVGEVVFLLRVVGRHRLEHRQRPIAPEGDRTGIAKARLPLLLGRVLVLADRDEPPLALDQPAVAGRIGRREAERNEVRALRERGAQR